MTGVAVTDWSGASIQINSYDEYGAPAPGNAGRFGYTGQVWLPETGLYHYKNRAYNPELGRFMQTDPIGVNGGMNLYAYVGGDPVNLVDPLGLAWRKNTQTQTVCSVTNGVKRCVITIQTWYTWVPDSFRDFQLKQSSGCYQGCGQVMMTQDQAENYRQMLRNREAEAERARRVLQNCDAEIQNLRSNRRKQDMAGFLGLVAGLVTAGTVGIGTGIAVGVISNTAASSALGWERSAMSDYLQCAMRQ